LVDRPPRLIVGQVTGAVFLGSKGQDEET